jgi:Asp-tRNA(Asn)/Glu-tRNA(Gln) amidotransferase A subunit family amidase
VAEGLGVVFFRRIGDHGQHCIGDTAESRVEIMELGEGRKSILQACSSSPATGRSKICVYAHHLMLSQTNCLSDAFFDEAIESAKALDDHLNRTGQLKGPLHGLPISLKDNFNIKGKDSTVGFTSLVNDPAKYNATLVDILETLGAVRYCKTNVPTAMMIVRAQYTRVWGQRLI